MAEPTFETVSRSKVYVDIVEQILEKIRSGVYEPGTSLPPERTLAEQFGVSRGTLREALRVLEHTGVLDVRVGSGTYVTDDGQDKATVLRARAAVVGDYSPLDLIVARRAVEPVCAELAAQYRRTSDLEALGDRLAEQERLTLMGEDPSVPDLDFHIAVARSSQNGVLIRLVEQLVELMHQKTWTGLKSRSRAHDRGAQRFLEHHKMIFSAIQEGDAVRAMQAMALHLDAIESGVTSELP